ncbi:hypothetical protein PFISCL1PPCAC_11642, partial [Pristionchus fissidentatus]
NSLGHVLCAVAGDVIVDPSADGVEYLLLSIDVQGVPLQVGKGVVHTQLMELERRRNGNEVLVQEVVHLLLDLVVGNGATEEKNGNGIAH